MTNPIVVATPIITNTDSPIACSSSKNIAKFRFGLNITYRIPKLIAIKVSPIVSDEYPFSSMYIANSVSGSMDNIHVHHHSIPNSAFSDQWMSLCCQLRLKKFLMLLILVFLTSELLSRMDHQS